VKIFNVKIFKAEPLPRHHYDDCIVELADSLFIKSKVLKPGRYRRMFNEDFARPFSLRRTLGDNLIDVMSNDDELMKKLFGIGNTKDSQDLVNKAIIKLVDEIAQAITWSGNGYYYLHEDVKNEGANLISFSSRGVISLFGKHIQYIPKRKERHLDRDGEERPREVRILDVAKLMHFHMPTSIKRILAKQNKVLATLDQHLYDVEKFITRATHKNPNPVNHFDFKVSQNTKTLALYRATRRTGWNARDYSLSTRSDFFDCHRLIRFKRNQILLRDGVLNQLSSELSRVGRGYKTDFLVNISGVDKFGGLIAINELERKLELEEVGFKEIIDKCKSI
jgi:hypothetical protein